MFVMNTRNFSLIIFLLVSILSALCGADEECGIGKDSENAVNVYVGSHRNSSGEWLTSFSISKGDTDSEGNHNITLRLSQDVAECRGKKILHIRGELSGLSSSLPQNYRSSKKNNLFFHNKCGSNVAVLNDGRTARKINVEQSDHAVVFTHRPLEINETLEVKLEKKLSKFGFSLGIGVTTATPMDFPQILQHISSIKNQSWAWYNVNTYLNGGVNLKNYGKNLDTMEVGDRAAVKRSNTGSLHFYWNGIDQGPAASNIPHPVYGVVELYGNAAMVSIVED